MDKDKLIYKGRLYKAYEIYKKKAHGFLKITEPDYVAVIAMPGKNKILLERQYRHVLDKTIYEIPAGHIEKGESAIGAAKRELEEETGYRAKNFKYLFRAYTSPGLVTSRCHFVLATNLAKGRPHMERDEIIKTEVMSLDGALKLLIAGRILDGKAAIGILYCKYMNSGGGSRTRR